MAPARADTSATSEAGSGTAIAPAASREAALARSSKGPAARRASNHPASIATAAPARAPVTNRLWAAASPASAAVVSPLMRMIAVVLPPRTTGLTTDTVRLALAAS